MTETCRHGVLFAVYCGDCDWDLTMDDVEPAQAVERPRWRPGCLIGAGVAVLVALALLWRILR